MSYREVKQLPLRAFWLLSANISRLLAERDLRSLEVGLNATNGGEETLKFRDRLVVEMGQPIKVDAKHQAMTAKMDEGAIDKLKGLRGAMTRKAG